MLKNLLILVSTCVILIGCSLFTDPEQDIPTISTPPHKPNASNVGLSYPPAKLNTSQARISTTAKGTRIQRIVENRSSGGTIDQIKIDNPGDIPDYYIYPSQQQNLNIINQQDNDIATPNWQISW
ncbi:MAG: hypothetical protein ACK4M7_07460 [Burkholderiales bacterium]